MASLEGFNPAEVPATEARELLPAGEYPVILIETDLAKKASGAVQFEYCLQVTEGPHQNRRIYDSQNYTKKDGSPNTIGRGTLSKICRSVGVMNPKDTSELHHKKLIAVVGVRQDEGYDPKNCCKGFKAFSQQPAQQSQPQPSQGDSASAWASTMG